MCGCWTERDQGTAGRALAAVGLPADVGGGPGLRGGVGGAADRDVRFGHERFRRAGFALLYVPHGLDFGVWKPLPDKAGLRAKRGLDPDAFVIGVNAANNDAIRKAAPEMMLAFAKFHSSHRTRCWRCTRGSTATAGRTSRRSRKIWA